MFALTIPQTSWPNQLFYAFASFGMGLDGIAPDPEESNPDEFGDRG